MGSLCMQNYNGMVWNDSNYPIQYAVYKISKEELQNIKNGKPTLRQDISNQKYLNVQLEENPAITGFHHESSSTLSKQYNSLFILVQPGEVQLKNLLEIELDEYKISLKIKIGEFEKYLIKDVIIKSLSDIQLKVRQDLSIKNMTQEEAAELIKKHASKQIGNTSNEQKQKREAKYSKVLSQLKAAFQKSSVK